MRRDLIAIGASAGGVEALSTLIRGLPSDLAASVFVVLHLAERGYSVLPRILSRAGTMPALHPQDRQPIERGKIYVAPTNCHLMIEANRVRVLPGPPENGHRPAIDPLFRSAARTGGRRVMGVILSGLLDDGTAGLYAIKRHGGMALVQDPEEAHFNGMILSALENVAVDEVHPIAALAARLVGLTREILPDAVEKPNEPAQESAREEGKRPTDDEIDVEIAQNKLSLAEIDRMEHTGAPPAFSCPDCGGVLWEIQDEEMVRYRCRTGYAFSSGTLLAHQSDSHDAALWIALRALEESASLAQRLRERAASRGHHLAETRFRDQAREAYERAGILRSVLLRPDPGRCGEPPAV